MTIESILLINALRLLTPEECVRLGNTLITKSTIKNNMDEIILLEDTWGNIITRFYCLTNEDIVKAITQVEHGQDCLVKDFEISEDEVFYLSREIDENEWNLKVRLLKKLKRI